MKKMKVLTRFMLIAMMINFIQPFMVIAYSLEDNSIMTSELEQEENVTIEDKEKKNDTKLDEENKKEEDESTKELDKTKEDHNSIEKNKIFSDMTEQPKNGPSLYTPRSSEEVNISYSSYLQQTGWQGSVSNGTLSGTTGQSRRMEALKIQLSNNKYTGSIQYRSYVQSIGWQNWVDNNNISGTLGQSKRLEAIEIKLSGELANQYDIYYRSYVQRHGWLGWTKNGQTSGTMHCSYRIEAIEIKLVKKNSFNPQQSIISYLDSNASLVYQSYVQQIGWQKSVETGEMSGTIGESKRIEGIKIGLNDYFVPGSVNYSTYVEGEGWQNSVSDNHLSGTTAQSKRIEAFQVNLSGDISTRYDIYYRAHVSRVGWMDWAKNGEKAGAVGYQSKIEAIEIRLVAKGGNAPGATTNPYKEQEVGMSYQSYVQQIGWQESVFNGEMSGTTGEAKRIEGIKIGLNHNLISGSVNYSTYVEGEGWQNSVSDYHLSGTTAQSKRIEAIKINLSGDISNQYDVYYRAHVSRVGWMDWAKNGATAGSVGYQSAIEAIEIKLVAKGGSAPGTTTMPYKELEPQAVYQSYIQSTRWQGTVSNGETSGTLGQSKRLEAIKIGLTNLLYNGGIQYRTYVQSIGWQAWVQDNQMAGTIGQSKRIEAIEIQLTGDLATKYDIYYRTYIQSYGWLGWAKNGEIAGSTACSYRMEAIQIKIVPKGSNAPGDTANHHVTSYWKTVGNNTYYYKDGKMVTGWQVIGGIKFYFNEYGELKAKNARKIIDISRWQTNINWDMVKASGAIDGVIIRIHNTFREDDMFKNHLNNVIAHNIPYGIYIANYTENYSEAYETAIKVKKIMNDNSLNPTLGVYLDLESFPDHPPLDLLNTSQWESITKGFAAVIPNIKIYANYHYVTTKLTTTYLKERISWIARYNTFCGYNGKYDGWQYTSTGSIPGIPGNVDISVFGDMV